MIVLVRPSRRVNKFYQERIKAFQLDLQTFHQQHKGVVNAAPAQLKLRASQLYKTPSPGVSTSHGTYVPLQRPGPSLGGLGDTTFFDEDALLTQDPSSVDDGREGGFEPHKQAGNASTPQPMVGPTVAVDSLTGGFPVSLGLPTDFSLTGCDTDLRLTLLQNQSASDNHPTHEKLSSTDSPAAVDNEFGTPAEVLARVRFAIQVLVHAFVCVNFTIVCDLCLNFSGSMSQEKKLIHVFQDLQRLKMFVEINYVGFGKILKKYDKATGEKVGKSFMERLDSEEFYKSDEVGRLIQHAETVFFVVSDGKQLADVRLECRLDTPLASQ
jgi:hypothetical protein